ncbi:aldo/keto reductase [Candidatus Aminicenantes bacterium AH-873-B07]|jgi:predicted aldo/keto reductase-like oxidoreductase|nr:aldo/keto reductase [Candidatus Aminicenantes bacterium AH-873-B07]
MIKINRRNFFVTFASGILSFGFLKNLKVNSKQESISEETQLFKIKKYNPLGNTGLKVSDVSCGAISLFNPNVLRYAYECGVNYFDTAESYLRTKSETFIGQALKDVRDKVIITTKHAYGGKKKIEKSAIIKRIEASLKRLQTDYIDIALVHNIDDLSILKNEELLSAYYQLKKEGKIRFTGFSTHNAKVTLKQALDLDFVQVILLIYNHLEGKEIEPLIKEVRKKGIGTIAMKVFAGGKQGNLKRFVSKEVSYSQAAIRWVLSNPYIDCCIVTMSSYSHVEEYVAASGKPLQRADLKVISEYQREVNNLYCRVSCDKCLSSCPNNVAINEILRHGMYFEDYGMEKEAVRYYAELEEGKKPLSCKNCSGYCEKACPYGLKVKNRLLHVHEILTV